MSAFKSWRDTDDKVTNSRLELLQEVPYPRGGMIDRAGRSLHQIAGVVMILIGVAMMTGQLSALSCWVLDGFSALGRIG